MKIIEITALTNGAHRNQSFLGYVPEGWAVISDDMETPNFPFGTVEVEEISGVMTVTSWTAGTIPQPDPQPDPQPTIAERMTAVEDAVEILLSGRTE